MRGRINKRGRVRVLKEHGGEVCLVSLTPAGAKRCCRNAQRRGIWRKGQTLSITIHAIISHELHRGAPSITAPPAKRRAVKGKRYSVARPTSTTRAVKGGQDA